MSLQKFGESLCLAEGLLVALNAAPQRKWPFVKEIRMEGRKGGEEGCC